MPKFKIHVFQNIRETHLVEAESIDEAATMFEDLVTQHSPVETELTGDYMDYFLVDPVLDNGEVDYEKSKWY